MSVEKPGLIIAGVSGPGVQEFLRIGQHHGFPGEVVAFASANPDSAGKTVGETALAGISKYDDRKVISAQEACDVEAPVVVSFLSEGAAGIYEESLAAGRVLITGTPPSSTRDDIALVSPYTNHGQLAELFQKDIERSSRIIAIGESTSIGAAVAMAPLHRKWGIVNAEILTLQGWRDARSTDDDTGEVPQDKQDSTVDISTTDYIRLEHEPQRLLSRSMSQPAAIDIDATLKHGPWREGYHELVTVTLAAPATKKAVKKAMRAWKAPKALKGMDYGADSPDRHPLNVSKVTPLIHWEDITPELTKAPNPMRVRVHVRAVEEDEQKVTLELVGADEGLGYAGSLAMNLAYAKEKGYLSNESS